MRGVQTDGASNLSLIWRETKGLFIIDQRITTLATLVSMLTLSACNDEDSTHSGVIRWFAHAPTSDTLAAALWISVKQWFILRAFIKCDHFKVQKNRTQQGGGNVWVSAPIRLDFLHRVCHTSVFAIVDQVCSSWSAFNIYFLSTMPGYGQQI